MLPSGGNPPPVSGHHKLQMHFDEYFYFLFFNFICAYCDLQVGAGGSHRTLLYGQAVLFLHTYSGMVSHFCLLPL